MRERGVFTVKDGEGFTKERCIEYPTCAVAKVCGALVTQTRCLIMWQRKLLQGAISSSQHCGCIEYLGEHHVWYWYRCTFALLHWRSHFSFSIVWYHVWYEHIYKLDYTRFQQLCSKKKTFYKRTSVTNNV